MDVSGVSSQARVACGDSTQGVVTTTLTYGDCQDGGRASGGASTERRRLRRLHLARASVWRFAVVIACLGTSAHLFACSSPTSAEFSEEAWGAATRFSSVLTAGQSVTTWIALDSARVLRSAASPTVENWQFVQEQSQRRRLWQWRFGAAVIGVRAIEPGRSAAVAEYTFADFGSSPPDAAFAHAAAIGLIDSLGTTVTMATWFPVSGAALATVSLTSRRVLATLTLGARQILYVAPAGNCGAGVGATAVVLAVDASGNAAGPGLSARPDTVWAFFVNAATSSVVRRVFVAELPHLYSGSGKFVQGLSGGVAFALAGTRLVRLDCASMLADAAVDVPVFGLPVVLHEDGSIIMNDYRSAGGGAPGSRLLHYSTSLARLPDIPIPSSSASPVPVNAVSLSADGTRLPVTTGLESMASEPFDRAGRVLVLRTFDFTVESDRQLSPSAVSLALPFRP